MCAPGRTVNGQRISNQHRPNGANWIKLFSNIRPVHVFPAIIKLKSHVHSSHKYGQMDMDISMPNHDADATWIVHFDLVHRLFWNVVWYGYVYTLHNRRTHCTHDICTWRVETASAYTESHNVPGRFEFTHVNMRRVLCDTRLRAH